VTTAGAHAIAQWSDESAAVTAAFAPWSDESADNWKLGDIVISWKD